MTDFLHLPDRFLLFLLVLTRISGLVMTAPVLGNRSAPMRVRALLAVGMAIVVAPLQMQTELPQPGSLLELGMLIAGELIVGLSLGMGVMILLSGVQLTGQIMGQMSGSQIAEAFDPTYDQSVPVYSQFLDMLTLAVFVIIGGHREVIDALLGTFRAMPLGGGSFRGEMAEAMVTLLTQSFIVGIRAAAPAIVALLLSVLILGVVSRTLPQLNIMAVGFSVNATVMLAIVVASLGGIVWAFQDEVGPTVDLLREALAAN